jgi:hypothetical protein
MRPRTPEALFDAAQTTRNMLALTQRFLDGKATAVEVEVWARAIDHNVFRSWIADDLHTCLYNIQDVRREDLEWHIAEIRAGTTPFDKEPFARLNVPLSEIARRVQSTTTRFYIEGLGAFEGVRFASLATARPFFAATDLSRTCDVDVVTVHYPQTEEKQLEIVQDLFDTLVIGEEETSYVRAPALPRWRLMRLDDNCNTAQVSTFTGYAKARAALAHYESKLHKQSYWLEQMLRTG